MPAANQNLTHVYKNGILELSKPGGAFMEKKKNFIQAAVLAILIVLFCCACGTYSVHSGKDVLKSIKSTEKKANKEIDTELPELKIGTTIFAPYFYIGEDGKETGVDVDIAKEACKRIGYEPVFEQFTWGEHDKLLNAGAIDCIWNCFSMNEREEQYTWAGPYMYSADGVVVAADSDIHSLADLEGKTVAVEVDSKAEDFFLKENAVNVKLVSTYASLEDSFTAFGKGYVDAVADHTEALRNFTSKNEKLYRYIEPPIFTARLGVAFKKGTHTKIAAKLTNVLDEMNKDGTMAKIAKKYGLRDVNLLEVSANGK